MQTSNSLEATKRTGVDAKSASSAAANTALPYWDNNEINKRLEEHTRLLTEWEELLNKTGGPEVTSISQQDATRHIVLKRKLHESLGVMARIVQNQLKMKKPAAESVPTGAAPVMVPNASVPNQSATYAQQAQGQGQGNGYTHNQQNLSTQPLYQQQMGAQQVPSTQDQSHQQQQQQQQQQQYNNGYQQNAYVPNGGGQYYAYNNNGVANGQMQGQMQGQGMAQQMYIPNYNNASYNTTMGNATSAPSFTPAVTHNLPTAYSNTTTTNANGNVAYPNMMYSYPANNMYNAPVQAVQSIPATMPQNVANNTMSSTTNATSANSNNYTYNTSTNMYPSADNASMMYGQQMLQPLPTSYYGNSSIPSLNSTHSGTNVSNTQSTSPVNNTMNVPPQYVQQAQAQQMPLPVGFTSNLPTNVAPYATAALPPQYTIQSNGPTNPVMNNNNNNGQSNGYVANGGNNGNTGANKPQ